MKICVIDGQGGGIGSVIIRRIREVFGESFEVLALGTNAIAVAQMLKAKANRGASGENAIVHTVKDADVILGAVGIVLAHSMMGEVTPRMAEAIADSPARKMLLPVSQENIEIIGVRREPLPHLVEELCLKNLKEFIDNY